MSTTRNFKLEIAQIERKISRLAVAVALRSGGGGFMIGSLFMGIVIEIASRGQMTSVLSLIFVAIGFTLFYIGGQLDNVRRDLMHHLLQLKLDQHNEIHHSNTPAQ